ncbi:MAG: hypothetical protein LAO07_14975 [Acidobacteriia bacterium]|nr:hypothetical protein [Terriglobia bacterium]
MDSEPARLGKPKKHRSKVSGGAVALVILLGLLAFLSYRPVTRLRSDPPASFLEIRKEWDAKRREAEERVARAYWQQALQVIEVKYEYGTPLPTQPPAEFTIEKKGFPAGDPEASSAARARYWERLRVVWNSPQAWEKSYEWSTAWLGESLVSFEQAIHRFVSSVFGEFSK